MKLRYVGDGPRDEAMLPRLVARAVGEHDREFVAWKDIRLHSGRGYARKLRFVVRAAEGSGDDGVVAVLDTDRDGDRRTTLTDERESQRASGAALPIAVGAAHPHGEAWLVDDLEPLRDVLGLPAGAPAPPGRNPKAELEALIVAAGLDAMTVIGLLADRVEVRRCRNARGTGLEAFAEELRREFARR